MHLQHIEQFILTLMEKSTDCTPNNSLRLARLVPRFALITAPV